MKKIKIVMSLVLIPIMFSGCISKVFNVGKSQGYCQENGCDYSDAGVCSNPYDILLNKDKAQSQAYANIECFKKDGL